MEKMDGTPGQTVEGKTLADIIREDGWEEAQDEGHRQGTQQTQQTLETTQKGNRAGDARQHCALHQGQDHSTHVMGVVHGTTGSAHHWAETEESWAETEESWEFGCVRNVACGRRTSCRWGQRREKDA